MHARPALVRVAPHAPRARERDERASATRIEERRAELFAVAEPGERAQAARLLERLAAAIEDLR